MKFFESLFAGNFNDNPDYFKLIRISIRIFGNSSAFG